MSFLAPFFLAGLAALGIPVVIHLINRERREVVQFPSLMFLQRIPYRSVRRQKLRHLLLLTLRCLALAILVMAFARPFIRRDAPMGAAGPGARELVVLVDRSYSMGAADHWSRAQNAARQAVAKLTPIDRATVVAFDNEASAVTPPTSNIPTLDAAIANLRPGAQATRYAPPLKLASQILAGSNLPRREVVLISDFQRLGWTVRDEISFPTGTTITSVDVAKGDTALANAAVADVNIQRNEGERDRATIAARLTNTGPTPIANADVTLELNGRIAETKRVTIPARGAAQVRFAPFAIPAGSSSGLVTLATTDVRANQLAADDRYYFTIAPEAGVSVLLVQPSNPRANESLYLTRALAIGDRPSFRVDIRKTGGLAAADLDNRSLIIFDEVPPPANDGAARLRDFIENGGGVLIIGGDQLPVSDWTRSWSAILPATIGPVIDRAGDAGGTLAWVDYDHPVFDVFNAPRSGDFATARFLRYRRLTVRADSGSASKAPVSDTSNATHVLARFDDGAPALVERRVGRGKVLIWASTFDSYWNDLALQPVYLPFVHQLAKYAGRYSGARSSFTAGDVLDLSRHGELTSQWVNKPGGLTVEAPSGDRTHLPSAGEGLIPLREQGFYEVRPEGAARGMGRRVAVNLDPAEANFARIDPEELKASVLASAGGVSAGAAALDAPTREDTERRQTIWWYLLALAGILLATETLMSNRLSRRGA